MVTPAESARILAMGRATDTAFRASLEYSAEVARLKSTKVRAAAAIAERATYLANLAVTPTSRHDPVTGMAIPAIPSPSVPVATRSAPSSVGGRKTMGLLDDLGISGAIAGATAGLVERLGGAIGAPQVVTDIAKVAIPKLTTQLLKPEVPTTIMKLAALTPLLPPTVTTAAIAAGGVMGSPTSSQWPALAPTSGFRTTESFGVARAGARGLVPYTGPQSWPGPGWRPKYLDARRASPGRDAGAYWVRRRSMDPLNFRALKRSMRRVHAFAHIAKSAITFTRQVRMKRHVGRRRKK